MKKVGQIMSFQSLEGRRGGDEVEKRMLHALEYIAVALGAQAEVMVEQHNARVDAELMESLKEVR